MNKDLAVVGVAAFSACLHVVKEPPKMVLRRMIGPSLETGAGFRCCTVGELLRDCDLVSVLGVQEKCDEKRQALTRPALPCRHLAASREKDFDAVTCRT